MQATEAVKLILGIRRTAGGTSAAVRRAGDAVPRIETAPESGVPDVRRSSDDHKLIDYHEFCGVPRHEEVRRGD